MNNSHMLQRDQNGQQVHTQQSTDQSVQTYAHSGASFLLRVNFEKLNTRVFVGYVLKHDLQCTVTANR